MIMRAFPVSALASSPQARYEQITEQMQAGLLSREQALMLLENPDVDGWSRREFADRRLVDKILDDAMAYGISGAHTVSRYMNLPYARKQAWLAYNEAHLIGAPASHLEAIEEICGAVESEIQNMEREKAEAAAAAAAAVQPAPNPMPMAPNSGAPMMSSMATPPTPAPLPMPGAA